MMIIFRLFALAVRRIKFMLSEIKLETSSVHGEVLKIMREKYGWQIVFDASQLKTSIDGDKLNTTVEIKSWFTKYGKIESEAAFKTDLEKVCEELGLKTIEK